MTKIRKKELKTDKKIMLKILTQQQKEDLYIDYINNFLTIEKFAEYYRITEELAMDLRNEVRNYDKTSK